MKTVSSPNLALGVPAWLLGLAGAGSVWAADGADLLARACTAGGGAAWESVRTLHTHARLVSGGQPGDLDAFEDVRAGRFLRETKQPTGDRADGYDGVSVWTRPAGVAPYVFGDADSRLGAVNDGFRAARGWCFPARWAFTSQYLGEKTDGGRSFAVVAITPEGGRPFSLWLDPESHLIARMEEQQAEGVAVVRYDDYRAVGGVKLPFRIVRDDEYFSDQTETVQTVELNPAVSDSRFAIPPAPPISGPASVTVPFRLENGKMLIPIRVNGRGPYDAEFDSGGGFLIPPGVIPELGLTAAGTLKMTGGGEGSTTATNGVADTLSIGAMTLDHVRFDSFEPSWASTFPKRLLVGQEVLARYVVRVDFDAMTLTLIRPDSFDYRGPGAVIPFHFQDNQPEIIGAVDGIAGVFTIDTGDNGSLLLIAPFARRYGLAERYHATIPYGGMAITATYGLMARAGEVTFNGPDGRPVVHVEKPVTRISLQHGGYDADRYVSGNIGIGILKQFNVTFDYARQRLILEPNHAYGLPDVFNRSGLRLTPKDGVWMVDAVYKGGAGEAAGVHVGEVVVAIEGEPQSKVDRAALQAIMTGPVGTPVRLDFRAGQTTRTVTLELRDIL